LSDRRLPPETVEQLRRTFGSIEEDVPLARYTAARIGGPADVLLTAGSAERLAMIAETLWGLKLPFRILGGGSNVLVADAGIRGIVVLNQARGVRFWESPEGPRLRAESGAGLGSVARRAVERGWSGLEWAATVPGTLGGAVVGNAGAHGGDIAGNLELAEILQRRKGAESWPPERLEFAYRDSWLKHHSGEAVVLAATLRLTLSTVEATKAKMQEFSEQRRTTQPPGASMGSMFKNPPGDYAGRLIEACGLKGFRVGGAQISEVHANFFINLGEATAVDVKGLIDVARKRVAQQFDVELELEVELLGDWQTMETESAQLTDGGAL
jgi:UDP-N-acetylmuramate dehydrogenase